MAAIRQTIRYLGFVIDTNTPGDESVTHALVNLQEGLTRWHIELLSNVVDGKIFEVELAEGFGVSSRCSPMP